MIDCPRAQALIEARLDGEATAAEDRLLDLHVAGCQACAARLASETALDGALAARFAGVEAPASLAAGVRRRIETEGSPRMSGAGWIADALNAAGLLLGVVTAAAVVGPGQPLTLAAIGVAALVVGGYPLLLSALAGDAGPGEPGPARPLRQG
jgi:anti-sigma factor RsiW